MKDEFREGKVKAILELAAARVMSASSMHP